jgi:uncharacterized protein YcfL
MRIQWMMPALVLAVLLAGCGSANDAYTQDQTVSWEDAVEILNSGEVVTVVQLHSLQVTLELSNGSRITTTEPHIDDIFDEVEQCGSPCRGIVLVTE